MLYLEGLVLLEEPVPLGDLLVVGLAVDGGLGLQGGDLILDVDLHSNDLVTQINCDDSNPLHLSDEPLGAVDEEVPLPVAEEHVLAEVPLQHRDQSLLRHLKYNK